MAINKIQTAGGTENILGNIGIKRNGNGYLIAGDLQSYNGNGIDNPFTISMDLAKINGKSINQNSDISAGLMHLTSFDLYAGNPTTIGKELYLAYLPFTTNKSTDLLPVSYSSFSSLPYYFAGFPNYDQFGTGIAAGIINLGRTVAMTLEEGDVLFGFSYKYRVRNSLAVEFIGKWYVIDSIDAIWPEGAERPERISISGHCVNRTVSVSYSGGVISDVTTPDETDTFSFSYSYRDFGEGEVDENTSLSFNSNYFKNFYSQKTDLPVVGRMNDSYYSSQLSSFYLLVVTGKLSTPPVSSTDGFIPVALCDITILTIDTSGTPTPCYTENDSVQLYAENYEPATESYNIGGNIIEIGYNRKTHSFNPNLSTLLKPLQSRLVSGTNIKTVNNQSLLGEGNITIEGGGGTEYTAGDGINIEDNVISADVTEQRVAVDTEDVSAMHAGIKVYAPYFKAVPTTGATSLTFVGNTPTTDDPQSSSDIDTTKMTFTIEDIGTHSGSQWTDNGDGTYSIRKFIATDITIDGTSYSSGTNTYVIKEGSVITHAGGYLSALFNGSSGYSIFEDFTGLTVSYVTYVTSERSGAFMVNNGAETQLTTGAHGNMVVGNMVVGTFGNNVSFNGTGIKVAGSKSGNMVTVNMTDALTDATDNLTIGYDTTYNAPATYYDFQYGVDVYTFLNYFYLDSDDDNYWKAVSGRGCLQFDVAALKDNLSKTYNGNAIVFLVGDMDFGGYIYLDGGVLKWKVLSSEKESDMTYDTAYLNDFARLVADGTAITLSSDATIGNPTVLQLFPGETGYNYQELYLSVVHQMGIGTVMYGVFSDASYVTAFPYESTNTAWYQNHPEKLNHFIRYADGTGSAVANRKAYLLTDLNIAQAAYIQQLEARITALETRLNNYNRKNMSIEEQYPGSSMAG